MTDRAARVRGRLRLAGAYLRGDPRPAPGPSTLAVETTVRCNLRCPMCPRTTAGLGAHDMPDGMLDDLLVSHASMGGDSVYLYGLGEPLLDPRIHDIIRRCRGLGLGTVLSTNGTLLDRPRRAALLASGVDHVIVSIDAARPETYARYRPGGELATVEAGTRALAAEKVAARVHTRIVVQMVRLAHNRDEEPEFVRRWSRVEGIDGVRLKEEEIGVEGHLAHDPSATGRPGPCHILWRGPLITRWDGRVHACHPLARADEPLGDLRTASLEEIWRSPAAEHLRRLHAEGRPEAHPRCAVCPVVRPRRPFVVAAIALGGVTAQRALPVAEGLAARGAVLFAARRRA